MKTLEEIRKEYYEKRMNKLAFMGDAGSEFKDNLWSWITDNFVPKSTISQTKQELIEEAKREIYKHYKDETVASGHRIWNEALDLSVSIVGRLSELSKK